MIPNTNTTSQRIMRHESAWQKQRYIRGRNDPEAKSSRGESRVLYQMERIFTKVQHLGTRGECVGSTITEGFSTTANSEKGKV